MMNSGDKNGLKGQYKLAQGKRSVALGWETEIKIVRALTSFREKSSFRTEWNNSFSIQICPGLEYAGLSGRQKTHTKTEQHKSISS